MTDLLMNVSDLSQTVNMGDSVNYHYLGTTVKEKIHSTYTIVSDLGKGTFG